MKSLVLSLGLLAAAAASLPLAAPAAAGQFEIQDLMSTYNQAEATAKPKQMQVRNAGEIDTVFGLAARQRGRQAIEISCKPASAEWCAGGFVAACDKNKGGLSSDPDGGVTCSLPHVD